MNRYDKTICNQPWEQFSLGNKNLVELWPKPWFLIVIARLVSLVRFGHECGIFYLGWGIEYWWLAEVRVGDMLFTIGKNGL